MTDRPFIALLLGLALLCVAGAHLISSCGERTRLPVVRHTPRPGRHVDPPPPAGVALSAPPSRTLFSPYAVRRRALVFAGEDVTAASFVKLGEPAPGDWLYAFKEPGQTFADYRWLPGLNRKTPRRKTLHLLPYADLDAQQRRVLAPLREYLSIFFDSEVKLLRPERLKRAWHNPRRRQYRASHIASYLASRVQPSSLGLFGLTGKDLYALRLNFVFGLAMLTRRAGIYSVHRYGRTPALLLRRTLKLASHEIGHMFGLKHCVFYKCTMNGTNSLAEMARQPLHLCPVCQRKLQWNLRYDAARRYRRLAAFYRRHGFVVDSQRVLGLARAGRQR
jgi:archaemetzincin